MLLSVNLSHCQIKNKEMSKANLEQLAIEEYKYVKQYPVKPVYSVQISKQGCRVIIEGYADDYRFVENGGESMMIPFNIMITKSGEQKVKIKIYPKEGDFFITKYAHVQATVYNAPDKDSSLSSYKAIATFNLPQGLDPQKLPYYEGVVIFNAEVPFDYSKDLDEAKDLTKIENIKDLVKKKYIEIQNIAKSNDEEKYIRESLFDFGKVSNTTYQTLNELKYVYRNGSPLITPSPRALDKEFLPLDDCELQFYAAGKVVALWHKVTMTSGLDMKFKYKKEDGSIGESTNADPLFLWLPAGSNELKIW
jgi:hypothetical protein